MNLRHHATVATALAAVLLPLSAQAVTVDLSEGVELYGGNYSRWQVRDDLLDECTTGPTTTTNGFAVEDARYGNPVRADAFDHAHMVLVDGTHVSDADNDGALTNNSVTAGPLLGQVRVWVTHTALPTQPVIRTLVRLTNGTNAAHNRTISFHARGGGFVDHDTFGTQDGDPNLEPGDNWVTWGTPDSESDPKKATALAGPGNVREEVTGVPLEPGEPMSSNKDCVSVNFQVGVPANSTRYLVFLTRLEDSSIAAGFATGDFSAERAYLFAGLTAMQKSRVLNWAL